MGAFWSEERSYVGVDLTAGSVEATEHLISGGRRKIAHIAPANTGFVAAGERYEGYRDAMLAAGLEPWVLPVDDNPDRRIAAFTQLFEECLAAGTMPDALHCFYDDMATDAIYALQAMGLRPGQDVALIGFNGTIGIDRGPYPLSTVRQPIETMCALAFEFLKTHIEDPTAPVQQRILKPELIVRATSGF